MEIDIDPSYGFEKEPQIESARIVPVISSTLRIEVAELNFCFFVFVVPQAVLRTGLSVLRVPFIKGSFIPCPAFPSCHPQLCLLERSKNGRWRGL